MSATAPLHHFGRTARSFNPRVPHLSALVAGKKLPRPPSSVDYTRGMPASFGMMLNDRLSDCTCAAYYHALQIWTFRAKRQETTEHDHDVEQLYIQACGYDPNVAGPGKGGNKQRILSFLLNQGAPIGRGTGLHRILAFVEIDPRNINDVKRTIADCGVAYVGFPVPENVTYKNRTWSYDPKAKMTEEGHSVVLAGYDATGAVAISWGRRYKLTWSFITHVLDEAYAIADPAWIEASGKTLAGMTLPQLEAQMEALKSAAAASA